MIKNNTNRIGLQFIKRFSSSNSNNLTNGELIQQLNPDVQKFCSFTPENGYVWKSFYGTMKVQNLPFHEYVWKDLKKWQNKTAFVCGVTDRQYTYSQARDHSAAFAIRLQNTFRLKQGDVIALCMPNMPEWPITALGAIEAGICVTTMNPIYSADEIARQLILSDTKLVIGMVENYPTLQEACKIIKKQLPIIVLRTDSSQTVPTGAIDLFEMLSTNGINYSSLKSIKIDPNDICMLPYSSGTTGLNKGVMLTHNNLTSNSEQIGTKLPIKRLIIETTDDHQDVLPLFVPFFHISGLLCTLFSKIALGTKMITLPKFQPDTFIKSLTNATFLQLVPPVAIFVGNFDGVTDKHLKSLRLCMCGSAPLGGLDVERFRKKAPKVGFIQAYGLTETSPVTHMAPIDSENFGSIGYPLASVEAKIVKLDDDKFIGIGSNVDGELVVRGPNVMKGYLNNKVATDEMIIKDGWCRTGDIASYDNNGYFYIKDRLKELIKVKGFQVPPAELEELLRSHPKVDEAAVVGIPHPINGEVPRAFIVKKQNVGEISEKEIQDYVADKVIKYKHLVGGVQIIENLPKNTAGKILRRQIKLLYCSDPNK